MTADVSDVMQEAHATVHRQIVDNLNSLGEQGLLIDKSEYIASCVKTYGRETAIEASVPWINFLKLPGEVELVNCQTLRHRLRDCGTLYIAYGTGPWTAMRKWVSLDGGEVKGEPAVLVDATARDRVSYNSGSKEKIGRLQELWPACCDAALFGTVLRITAESWQVSLSTLASQDGWRHSGSMLWGRLLRR